MVTSQSREEGLIDRGLDELKQTGPLDGATHIKIKDLNLNLRPLNQVTGKGPSENTLLQFRHLIRNRNNYPTSGSPKQKALKHSAAGSLRQSWRRAQWLASSPQQFCVHGSSLLAATLVSLGRYTPSSMPFPFGPILSSDWHTKEPFPVRRNPLTSQCQRVPLSRAAGTLTPPPITTAGRGSW